MTILEKVLGAYKGTRRVKVFLTGPRGRVKTEEVEKYAVSNDLPLLRYHLGDLYGDAEFSVRFRCLCNWLDSSRGMGRPHVIVLDGLEALMGGNCLESSKMAREILMFLTEEAPALVVGTCHDLDATPPEFTRVDRWDFACSSPFPDDPTRDECARHRFIMV